MSLTDCLPMEAPTHANSQPQKHQLRDMSASCVPVPGSANILFRKLFEHVTIDDGRLNEILSYPVDVDWVDACLQHHTCVPSVFAQDFPLPPA